MSQPRSMPPAMGPRPVPLDPAEQARLARYRREIAEILQKKADASQVKQALIEKAMAYRAERQKKMAGLYALLKGRSVSEVAHRAGYRHGTIDRILRGEREPRISTFLRLARALEVTPGEFYVYLREMWKHPIHLMSQPYMRAQMEKAERRALKRRTKELPGVLSRVA